MFQILMGDIATADNLSARLEEKRRLLEAKLKRCNEKVDEKGIERAEAAEADELLEQCNTPPSNEQKRSLGDSVDCSQEDHAQDEGENDETFGCNASDIIRGLSNGDNAMEALSNAAMALSLGLTSLEAGDSSQMAPQPRNEQLRMDAGMTGKFMPSLLESSVSPPLSQSSNHGHLPGMPIDSLQHNLLIHLLSKASPRDPVVQQYLQLQSQAQMQLPVPRGSTSSSASSSGTAAVHSPGFSAYLHSPLNVNSTTSTNPSTLPSSLESLSGYSGLGGGNVYYQPRGYHQNNHHGHGGYNGGRRNGSFGGNHFGSPTQHGQNRSAFVWNGELPPRNYSHPVFSQKIFVGGVPWDVTEEALLDAFLPYGSVRVEWPGKEARFSRSHGRNMPRGKVTGYVYMIFDHEKSVKALLHDCSQEFGSAGEWYFKLRARRNQTTEIRQVQVIPWVVSDASYVEDPCCRLDPKKTVFVGALHGMITAQVLFSIMNELYDNVVFVGIDTDKHKYPIGSGRVTFSSHASYFRAIESAFLEIKTSKFAKKVQIDPFLEEMACMLCHSEPGPLFCRDRACFRYFCEQCWAMHHHRSAALGDHKPLSRNSNRSGALDEWDMPRGGGNGFSGFGGSFNGSAHGGIGGFHHGHF